MRSTRPNAPRHDHSLVRCASSTRTVVEQNGTFHQAVVLEISREIAIFRMDGELCSRTRIAISIPSAGSQVGRIAWHRGAFHACEFVQPVTPDALELCGLLGPFDTFVSENIVGGVPSQGSDEAIWFQARLGRRPDRRKFFSWSGIASVLPLGTR